MLGTVYAALTEAREEENAGRQQRGQPPAAASQPALPPRNEIIGYLEKARPARLYDNSLHMTLARLYLDEENWAKAIEVTSYVVEREPGAVDAAFMLAQAYEGAGKLNEAIAALEEATLVDPDSPRALVYLGELYGRVRSTKKRPARSTAPRRCGRACWICGCVRRARWSARDARPPRAICCARPRSCTRRNRACCICSRKSSDRCRTTTAPKRPRAS